jgi:ribosomal protein L40E
VGFIRKTSYYSQVTYEWNLPAGHTCPFARDCRVSVNRDTGKFTNESILFKCYAASSERFPSCRKSRWDNLDAWKSLELPKKATHIRIHASGDFFSQEYFDFWLEICRKNPNVKFWAFTKSIIFWINRISDIPDNLVLTASYGGYYDNLIDEYSLKSAKVYKTKNKAKESGLPIDINDDIAMIPTISFALIDNFSKG